MPIARIEVLEGYTADQKQQLLKQTSQAIQTTLNAVASSVHVLLHEYKADHCLHANQASQTCVYFNIDILAGRTEEQKANLMAQLYKVTTQIPSGKDTKVVVLIHDIEPTSISVQEGLSIKAVRAKVDVSNG